MRQNKEEQTAAKWNLCLGLSNKKDLMKEIITAERLDICCIQETEIPVYEKA